ncbi:MAG TPA: efflux RND transporter periplasmic adaptor subunit [Anaerolineales bacterium]|nr:efflux RND transporter periplasmic adaptor subunit [Anaerolineales bacterium]
MKKYAFRFVLLTLAVLVLTACGAQAEEPTTVSASQPPMLIAEGSLQPVNMLGQAFSMPGQVAEVLVADGEVVTQGQVLARLNGSPETQTALARAQQEVLAAQQALDGLATAAELNLAQANLAVLDAQEALDAAVEAYDAENSERNQAAIDLAQAQVNHAQDVQAQLESGAGVDPDQLAAAEARLASANAALTSAQAASEALELKASMAGTVVDLTLQAGEWVAAAQPVITLADLSAWVVKTDNLTEIEVVGVEIGQQVKVVFDALPELTLNGEVTHINTRYEEKRGDVTYTVTVAISQPDPAMRWGMTAAVQFVP